MMLPSIYIYDDKKYEVPSYDINPPEVEIYTVYQFAKDVVTGNIPIPSSNGLVMTDDRAVIFLKK